MRDMNQPILNKIACSGCSAWGVVYVDTQDPRGAVNVRDMTQRILSKIACSGCSAWGAVYADTQALREAVNVRDMIQRILSKIACSVSFLRPPRIEIRKGAKGSQCA